MVKAMETGGCVAVVIVRVLLEIEGTTDDLANNRWRCIGQAAGSARS